MTLAIAVYLAPESTFGTDPSSNGSGYVAVRTAQPAGAPKRSLALLEQGWSVGRLRRVRKRVGPDGAELALRLPWHGYAAVTTEGNSVSGTLDALDLVLNSAFGAGTTFAGLGASGMTSTVFTADSDDRATGDALAVYQSSINSNRAQWRVIDSDVTVAYTVRELSGSLTGAASSLGYRRWSPGIVPSASNGPSLACHVALASGASWTLLGGRPTGTLRLVHEAGEETYLEVTIAFDSSVRAAYDVKGSLPAITTFSPAAIMGQLSGFLWGGTSYDTSRVAIEWTLGTADRKAVSGANGRSDITVRSADCKVSIAPPFATSWEDDFAAGTVRRIEVVHGAALVSGGVFNSSFFWAEAGQSESPALPEDDNSEARASVDLMVNDAGASARYWSLARA